MHKIDIQHATDNGFDVLCNGDHYMSYPNHAEAIEGAKEAGGGLGSDALIIRDFTQGPYAGKKYKVIEA